MSPKELRAFRESLGLSRREFAPRLFISEPTLERWERGQGGPREIHLRILQRMQDHQAAGQPSAYFEYDNASPAPVDLLYEQKQLVVETVQGMGIALLDEQQTEDGEDWRLSFGLAWAAREPIRLQLICEGSERPERPAIDFTLDVAAEGVGSSELSNAVQDICYNHALSWTVERTGDEAATVRLRQRVFKTGCNAETIRHVLGNCHAGWRRLKEAILSAPGAEESANT